MKLTPVMQRYIVHWGEMGSRWGLNRSVAQIHALLFLSPNPLHADEIADTLAHPCDTDTRPLRPDRRQHVWVRIADVVHVVAMKVHAAPAGQVFDPDAFGLGDGVQARRGHRLVKEGGAVTGQQRAGGLVEVLVLPLGATRRGIDVTFARCGCCAAAAWHAPDDRR